MSDQYVGPPITSDEIVALKALARQPLYHQIERSARQRRPGDDFIAE
jgi:hypothetical protein